MVASYLFSLLGKLAERAIYFANVFFSFILLFNGRLSGLCSSEANGLIFSKVSELVDECKGLFTKFSFLRSQGTLPWQSIKVEKSAFFSDQSTLSCCHSKRIAISQIQFQKIK